MEKVQTIEDFIQAYRKRLRDGADMYAQRLGYAAATGTKAEQESEARDARRYIDRADSFDQFYESLSMAIAAGEVKHADR